MVARDIIARWVDEIRALAESAFYFVDGRVRFDPPGQRASDQVGLDVGDDAVTVVQGDLARIGVGLKSQEGCEQDLCLPNYILDKTDLMRAYQGQGDTHHDPRPD